MAKSLDEARKQLDVHRRALKEYEEIKKAS